MTDDFEVASELRKADRGCSVMVGVIRSGFFLRGRFSLYIGSHSLVADGFFLVFSFFPPPLRIFCTFPGFSISSVKRWISYVSVSTYPNSPHLFYLDSSIREWDFRYTLILTAIRM